MDCTVLLLCTLHPFSTWMETGHTNNEHQDEKGGDILCHIVQSPPVCALHTKPFHTEIPVPSLTSSFILIRFCFC